MTELRIKISRDDVEDFVKITNRFDFDIDICSIDDHYIIDAKSIMGIFSPNLSKPTIVRVAKANGETQSLFEMLSKWAA